MIFKITFEDGRMDWCTAKDQLHLLKSYDADFELPIQEIESIEEISEEAAKTIMVRNTDFDEDNPEDMPKELSIWQLAVGHDFAIIASTEFD